VLRKLCFLLHIIGVSCQVCTAPISHVGSLDHNNMSYSRNTTYILDGYRVQCEGIVTAWEFCYQTLGVSSMTFYPGIWNRSTKDTYSLIQSNTVTFTPNGTSNSCQNYTLPVTEQFTAPSESVVGLYSSTGISLLLRTNNSNQQITTYQFDGNQSNVAINGNAKKARYNVALRMYVGKLIILIIIILLLCKYRNLKCIHLTFYNHTIHKVATI